MCNLRNHKYPAGGGSYFDTVKHKGRSGQKTDLEFDNPEIGNFMHQILQQRYTTKSSFSVDFTT